MHFDPFVLDAATVHMSPVDMRVRKLPERSSWPTWSTAGLKMRLFILPTTRLYPSEVLFALGAKIGRIFCFVLWVVSLVNNTSYADHGWDIRIINDMLLYTVDRGEMIKPLTKEVISGWLVPFPVQWSWKVIGTLRERADVDALQHVLEIGI